MTKRVARRAYRDPLDQVWLATAARLGLRVVRDDEVFAATDGRGILRVGAAGGLDADDCLAQMIFHELCHALVEGAEAFAKQDWGLDNRSDRDVDREWACLRVQAALARTFGLGEFLAPTTDARDFYDALGADALAGDSPDAALARTGFARADEPPFAPHLRAALAATAAVIAAVRPFADRLEPGELPSLYA